MDSFIPVIIIGAGPAGLAMGGRLRQAGIDFIVLEQSNEVAHSWHHHYDRLHLHTVKQFSHLPYLPFPDDYPQYVSRQQLVEYLEAYARHFDIQPIFGESVEEISRKGTHWRVSTEKGTQYLAKQVVVATGVNRVPYHPQFPDQEDFNGTILHSRFYKNARTFDGQKVLVVGMGNTGAEIALDLSENGIEVLLSIRGPVNIVPRDFLGMPTQLSALRLAKLPHRLGDWLGRQVQKLSIGNLEKYGIERPSIPPSRQLRETGQTPVIDLGTVAQVKAGYIKVVPGIEHFTPRGALFKNGEEYEFDSVILATGYRAHLEDFIPNVRTMLNDVDGLPKSSIGTAEFEGMYFIGFDNFKPGGIIGVIFKETDMVLREIQKN
ncbi:MAG TPA: NAD(P)/FAD-dependent oxidoreductase [Saprospiraceae bacterium]|nr:NAD(P)/FAD-dependent oxidoreductase [Saprospiraceae bacterium]HMQ83056.1 NAD(P)/FAD-dependent oxidoreductase [Saprospiraceae bacterium]